MQAKPQAKPIEASTPRERLNARMAKYVMASEKQPPNVGGDPDGQKCSPTRKGPCRVEAAMR
jgi:hypothetical protein